MREILRTSDVVKLSWLTALLANHDIDGVILDSHMSVLGGSGSAIPRRLMVVDEEYESAVDLLVQAGELVPPIIQNTNRVLGGDIIIHQTSDGYRSAIDPVFLAAAVPDVGEGRVLDVGSGVGTAALCYAARARNARVTCLELQPELVGLSQRNFKVNCVGERMRVILGDLLDSPPELEPESFDEVMANPPYLQAGRVDPPLNESKSVSTIEGAADLKCWVQFCIKMVVPSGGITLIHRADRLDDLLALLRVETGGIVVFPLWPSSKSEAKRVIVHARRGSKTPLRLSAGMVLHGDGRKFSVEAENVLRNGTALRL